MTGRGKAADVYILLCYYSRGRRRGVLFLRALLTGNVLKIALLPAITQE